ncbi:uncharacterized WD repeat-containing protein C2A9.03-like isoform X1 [Ananas comosus]|uniref:Putative WD repeat-containing protein n=1 Tax=Ananas comosus TaxID=4615 RepID=A0A199V6D5_ANACO|nr:uncharacterized WD repeat-containing protein C2A9.03-like isoform X1 [Ananas comosus]OAY72410.1 putative WD repeat-containing protein [Ananas comosus]
MAQFIDNDLDYMLQFGGILGFEFDYDSYEDDTDSERGGEDLDFNEDNEVKTETLASEAHSEKDIQGIPWERMRLTRKEYREIRLKQYRNYENLSIPRDQLDKECKQVEKGRTFFDFQQNTRLVKLSIVHFQLRNLLWATSKHDVYTAQNYSVKHWSSMRRNCTEVLNVAGQVVPTQEHCGSLVQSVSRVQISSMAVRENLLAAGGFQGELICKYLDQPGVVFCTKVTNDENAITNSVDIYQDIKGSTLLMAANNDCSVRIFDAQNFSLLNQFAFPWSVNSTSVSPDSKLLAVAGDSVDCLVADAKSGKAIGNLKGHMDYSFSSAWHPEGHILATGNQDKTCRLWDMRNLSESFTTLKGRMGAIRCIKFSSDGRFMAIAEPADFVHIYDAMTDYSQAQEIDLFGEIAGQSFSPDSEAFFVGVADRTYGSLIEFNRRHSYQYLDCFL